MSETAPHENPLVPNKKLRQIYTAMVEARLLDEHVAKLQRKSTMRHRMYSTSGQEACRVATCMELNPGDLISDVQVNATMDHLIGSSLPALRRHIVAVVSGRQAHTTLISEDAIAKRQLPWVEDANDRLHLAMGVALSFKTLKQQHIVVTYAQVGDLPKRVWKQVLNVAGKFNLPIIFVILPASNGRDSRTTNICVEARSAGVPGIPVDANDAVALYRVAQEAIGRARGGDGSVLIECISYQTPRRLSGEIDDPLLRMKNFMIGRQVCTEHWANRIDETFRKRLAATNN